MSDRLPLLQTGRRPVSVHPRQVHRVAGTIDDSHRHKTAKCLQDASSSESNPVQEGLQGGWQGADLAGYRQLDRFRDTLNWYFMASFAVKHNFVRSFAGFSRSISLPIRSNWPFPAPGSAIPFSVRNRNRFDSLRQRRCFEASRKTPADAADRFRTSTEARTVPADQRSPSAESCCLHRMQ